MKGKTNPVKKNMDKFHKPRTHKDKTKYDRKSESEIMQDELEPIINDMIDEGGPVYSNDQSCGGVPAGWIPSTEYDESDDLEDAKKIIYKEEEMDYSGAFESDVE